MDSRPYRKTKKGRTTRRLILEEGLRQATLHGLEGMTLSRLAEMLYTSKSGIMAHFGSKRRLQEEIVARAASRFRSFVFRDYWWADRGAQRVFAIVDGWFEYLTKATYGGCFFYAASAELDGLAEHPCRKIVLALTRGWYERLRLEIRRAHKRGELVFPLHNPHLAFELHALTLQANWSTQLQDSPGVLVARGIARRKLDAVLTPEGKGKVRDFERARPFMREAARRKSRLPRLHPPR